MTYTAFPNTFRRDILAGKRLIGCWSSLANPITTEILGLAGFDWLLLDAEHAPNDVLTLIPQLMALKDSPSAPVVRPPVNDAVIIKRLLDAGFYNFLIPFVESAEQARRAVAATRYPPAGIRGVSVAQRSNRYGTVSDYFTTVNDRFACWCRSRAGPAWKISMAFAPSRVWTASSSALPTSPLPWGISETPATPRCRQRCGTSLPALGAMGARSASLPPWKRTLAATLNKESNSWRSAPTRVSFGQPHRRCGTGSGSRPHSNLEKPLSSLSMHVLIAPDKFKGTLSAAQAADALAEGWREGWPADKPLEIERLPVADGGEGTAEAIHDALAGRWVTLAVRDPIGRTVEGRYALVESAGGERLAVLEMSSASGFSLVRGNDRNLLRGNTFGTGQLLGHALRKGGADRVVVGVGGSATNDGGMGMAAAGFPLSRRRAPRTGADA